MGHRLLNNQSIIMKKHLSLCLILLTACIGSNALTAKEQATEKTACTIEPLMAKYHETQTQANSKKIERDITLVRHGNSVAIHYSDAHITELWTKLKNNRMVLTRYFNKHQRGISYEPTEMPKELRKSNWDDKFQLLSQHTIEAMTLTKTSDEHCEQQQTRTSKNKHGTITLEWLPKQRLIKTYNATSHGKKSLLQLESVEHDAQAINQYFATLEGFDTTDYADIGDMESDPFLSKMINLGFIEHGPSGFYDSEGNDIGEDHHHGHNHEEHDH